MKKGFIVVLITIFALTSCIDGGRQAGNKDGRDSLRLELLKKDSIINEVFTSLNSITSNLSKIKERENILTSAVNSGELVKEPISQITEDIQTIDQLLNSNKEAIARLQQTINELKKTTVKVGSLQNLVEQLSLQIEEKNVEIALLKERIGRQDREVEAMAMQVDDLSSKVEAMIDNQGELEGEIRAKNEMLNTAYYIVGNRNDLISRGVVYKAGLIGRTLKVNEDRSLEAFTQIDVRNFDEVIIGKKRVELVTAHPENSYEFVMNDSGVFLSLVITDRDSFWKYAKVLVLSYR